MSPEKTLALIESARIVGIIRLDDLSSAVALSESLLCGGIVVQEFTLSNSEAFSAMEQVRSNIDAFSGGQAVLGIGSVRSLKQAQEAVQRGAQFVVTPVFQAEVVEYCKSAEVPTICGAFTPTEILNAWNTGASMVKVFPARSLGPEFIKDVLAPLPDLSLVPTGGVNLSNIKDYLEAGAKAVGVGGKLVDKHLVASRDWTAIEAIAAKYSECARTSSK